MLISYGRKGFTPNTPNQVFQAVQELCFLWERVTPFAVDFGLFHFAGLFHAQQCYTAQ